MQIKLIAHTQLSNEFKEYLNENVNGATDGQVVALTAIRTCYSYKKPSEIVETEGSKYFGEKGKEGRRLFNHIVTSGHTSTLEGITFTFAIEGVSRALLAQLTRHRHMSFSVQSQRYNKFSSDSRSGGFDYVIPESCKSDEPNKGTKHCEGTLGVFEEAMSSAQNYYNELIACGVPQEDARAVLPNSATCNLVMTANLRTILEFYDKRKSGNGAQYEITQLAERLKEEVIKVEPFTKDFFENN